MPTDEPVVNMQEAQAMLDEYSSVNLDEVAPATVTVAFREFFPDERAKSGFRMDLLHKDIETYVPMFLFNRMLRNQKEVQKLRRRRAVIAAAQAARDEMIDDLAEATGLAADASLEFEANDAPLNFAEITDQMLADILRESEPTVIWQAKEVLSVWRLTKGEEDMTLKRLLLGLDFEKIEGLFMRFFGAMLRRRQNRA